MNQLSTNGDFVVKDVDISSSIAITSTVQKCIDKRSFLFGVSRYIFGTIRSALFMLISSLRYLQCVLHPSLLASS